MEKYGHPASLRGHHSHVIAIANPRHCEVRSSEANHASRTQSIAAAYGLAMTGPDTAIIHIQRKSLRMQASKRMTKIAYSQMEPRLKVF